jgi:hypothetical protein
MRKAQFDLVTSPTKEPVKSMYETTVRHANDHEAAAEGRGKFVEGMRNVNFTLQRSDVLPAHISE